MLWEIDCHPRDGSVDCETASVKAEAVEIGITDPLEIHSARGFLIESPSLDADQVERLARELFADPLVDQTICAPIGDPSLNACGFAGTLLQVLLKPGVMDPVAQSAETAARDLATSIGGFSIDAIRTLRKYWIAGAPEHPMTDEQLEMIGNRILANDAIEQIVVGPLTFDHLQLGSEYQFSLQTVDLGNLDDDGLMQLSREGQLYLQLAEMASRPTSSWKRLRKLGANTAATKRSPDELPTVTKTANVNSKTCSKRPSLPRHKNCVLAGETTIGV